MMDWHRCIGCRYCIVGCPYGSRSFNFKDPRLAENLQNTESKFPTRMRGVVEKCNFCEERLARGLNPACVDACGDHEILFGDLNDPDSEVRKALAQHMTIRRKPGLGTQPAVYYIIDDPSTVEGFAMVEVKEDDYA
jgi:Fe-S-cluster-containing dehydrogenase component